jgi:hypothetical protein
MAVFTRMPGLVCVYVVSTAVHLDSSGVHLRAARTCRARFSCREYVLWHCVHTCMIRRQDSRVRVYRIGWFDEEMEKGGGTGKRWSGRMKVDAKWTPGGAAGGVRRLVALCLGGVILCSRRSLQCRETIAVYYICTRAWQHARCCLSLRPAI